MSSFYGRKRRYSVNYLKMCLGEANLGMNKMLTQKDRQRGATPRVLETRNGEQNTLLGTWWPGKEVRSLENNVTRRN